MNNLRRLVATLCLTSVFAITAFADTTPAPPCDPGETHGPPCSSAQMATDDSSNPGQTETALASDTSNTVDVVSVVEETLLQFLIF